MKQLIIPAIVLLGLSSQSFANAAAKAFSQYKIQVEFKDLDTKWLSGLTTGVPGQLLQKDGTFRLPSAMTRGGFPAELRIIQEYSVRLGGPIVPCGILLDLNPAFNGESIQLSGTSILRYPKDPSGSNTVSRFLTQENLVDLVLKEGEAGTVNLDGGGRMLITVTLLDATGRPVSE